MFVTQIFFSGRDFDEKKKYFEPLNSIKKLVNKWSKQILKKKSMKRFTTTNME